MLVMVTVDIQGKKLKKIQQLQIALTQHLNII